jgi:hypothetical protein
MSSTRIEQFQREGMAMQRVNHANSNSNNTPGSSSLTGILWYVFFGLNMTATSQKQDETNIVQSFQSRLNAIIWMISCIALGLGLLIGSFINNNFGLLPIVLLSSILLIVVSLPILSRSAYMLARHNGIQFHK